MVPSLVTFISFLIAYQYLGRHDGPAESIRYSRHASITIRIFTLTFLICNVPYFIFMCTLTAVFFMENGSEIRFHPIFLYFGVISRVAMPAINTVINPAILYTRMKKFHEWVDNKKRRLAATKTIMLRRMGTSSGPDHPITTNIVVSEAPGDHDVITDNLPS